MKTNHKRRRLNAACSDAMIEALHYKTDQAVVEEVHEPRISQRINEVWRARQTSNAHSTSDTARNDLKHYIFACRSARTLSESLTVTTTEVTAQEMCRRFITRTGKMAPLAVPLVNFLISSGVSPNEAVSLAIKLFDTTNNNTRREVPSLLHLARQYDQPDTTVGCVIILLWHLIEKENKQPEQVVRDIRLRLVSAQNSNAEFRRVVRAILGDRSAWILEDRTPQGDPLTAGANLTPNERKLGQQVEYLFPWIAASAVAAVQRAKGSEDKNSSKIQGPETQ